MMSASTASAPPAERQRGGGSRRRRFSSSQGRTGWLLSAPTVIITVAIIVLPILWNIVLATQQVSFLELAREGILAGEFSLSSFADTLTAAGFWRTLWTTVVYSVFSTAGSLILGLVAALVLRKPFRGRGPLRAFMLLPYVAPVVAVAFVWQVMLNPQYGVINHYLVALPGVAQPIDFLGLAPWALISVIGFEIWRYFPFAFLFLSARLVALPRDLEEAALVDGATPWQNFRFVVLPQLMNTLALLTVLRVIMTFNKFDDVYLLTGGAAGTEVAAVRVFNQLMGSFDVSGAAATAVILAVFLALFLSGYFAIERRREDS